MQIFFQSAGGFAIRANDFIHAGIVHAFGEVTHTDDGVLVFSPNIDHDLAAGGLARIIDAGITVVAVGDDLDQGAQNILADRLIRLLQGDPVSVLEFAADWHLVPF